MSPQQTLVPSAAPVVDSAVGALDGFTRSHAELDGTRISCMIGGAGPALVLLHGAPCTLEDWGPILPRFAAAGFTVFALELRAMDAVAETSGTPRRAIVHTREAGPNGASIAGDGGNSTEPVLADAAPPVQAPCAIESWDKAQLRADSRARWQLGAAGAFAAAIEGVVLSQGRRIAELTTSQEALTRALERKDVLAREIDHRVKNSLQIVAGVLLMQARGVEDPQSKAAFEDTYARLMSVARVHESLHLSQDIESVDLGQTLRQLCGDLETGMTGVLRRLDVSAEPGLTVPSQAAVALSLITTELVTNALKYAYAPGEPGSVAVTVTSRPSGGVELRVRDTGRGLPPDWSDRPRGSGSGLGMRIIRAMLEQIGAELEVEAEPPGACFTVLA